MTSTPHSALADQAPYRRMGRAVVRSFGKGPPLVLLHGGVGSWTHWLRNIPSLMERFRVHAVDLPGYGDAQDTPRGIAPDAYVALVHASLAPLAEEGPLLVSGFSFGGAVGGAFARMLGPACAGFAAVGPGGFGATEGRVLGLKNVPKPSDPTYRTIIRHNLAAMMIAEPAAIDEATIDIQIANISRTRFDSRNVSLRATLLKDIAAIQAPVMVVWGEADSVAWPTVAARARQTRDARPNVRIETIPGAGHWTQYERASETNALLLDFFRKQRQPTAKQGQTA